MANTILACVLLIIGFFVIRKRFHESCKISGKRHCIGCGQCVKAYPGGVLFIGTGGKPQIKDFSEFGWNDCWQRDHCLAVYQGAIEIGGYSSDDSLTLLLVKLTSGTLDTLITHALFTQVSTLQCTG